MHCSSQYGYRAHALIYSSWTRWYKTFTIDPSSRVYDPSSRVYDPSSRVYNPSSRVYDPSSRVYYPSSRVYDPSSRVYDPSSRVYDPSSRVYYRWLIVISVAVIYNLVVVVARTIFWKLHDQYMFWWLITDYLADVVYLTDIVVNMRTGWYSFINCSSSLYNSSA